MSFAPLGEHLLHFMEKNTMFELKNRTIKLSVRHMVEFLFRKGDIRSGKGAVQSELPPILNYRPVVRIFQWLIVAVMIQISIIHLLFTVG